MQTLRLTRLPLLVQHTSHTSHFLACSPLFLPCPFHVIDTVVERPIRGLIPGVPRACSLPAADARGGGGQHCRESEQLTQRNSSKGGQLCSGESHNDSWQLQAWQQPATIQFRWWRPAYASPTQLKGSGVRFGGQFTAAVSHSAQPAEAGPAGPATARGQKGAVAPVAEYEMPEQPTGFSVQPGQPVREVPMHPTRPGFMAQFSPLGARDPQADEVVKTPEGWLLGYNPARTSAQAAAVVALLNQRRGQFAYSLEDLGCYKGPLGPVSIPLTITEAERVYSPCIRRGDFEERVEREKVPPLISGGLVERSHGTRFASLNVIAAKKDSEGNYTDSRFCHNFKPLNAKTKTKVYGLPLADQLQQAVSGSAIFTRMDMKSGYLQIEISEEDQEKTAFWYERKLYKYKRMPFGLKNAPAEFQERMDRAIEDAGLTHCVKVYIDDLLIHSETFEEHLEHLTAVFKMLDDIGMKAHPEKSVFACSVVEFLGHRVSAHGLTPSEAKVQAIRLLPEPQNVADLRRVLGFMGYYRGYVPNYSAIAAPLHELLKLTVQWQWRDDPERRAYQALKDRLCDPACSLKKADKSKPYLLHTDFSNQGLGAVLGQYDDDGLECIVACISRSLNKAEKEYASYKGEMLAAVWAVKTLDYYLRGSRFTLVTDHAPLVFLMTSNKLTGLYARWSLVLQEYSFDIVHRPGAKHQNADCLSRHPLPGSNDNTGARMDHDLHDQPASAVAAGNIAERRQVAAVAVSSLSALLAQHTLDPEEGRWVGHCCFTSAGFMTGYVSDEAAGSWGSANSWWSEEADDSGAAMDSAVMEEEQRQAEVQRASLRARAAQWVSGARTALSVLRPAAAWPLRLGSRVKGENPHGLCVVEGLDTSLLGVEQLVRMWSEGVTLYEPFGGLAAGAEMLLRNGVPIRRYLYSDTSGAARKVAAHRLQKLTQRFGDRLFPAVAWATAFTALPADVSKVKGLDLVQAGALDGTQWVVVGGWECQDLSPAGSGRGLEGAHSCTFFALLKVLGFLQQLQPHRRPAYLLENTAMKHPTGAQKGQVGSDFQLICAAVGPCVELDAARLGSYAHRLRDYWTNLACAEQLQAVFDRVERDPTRQLTDILEAGRQPQLCRRANASPPWYAANKVGEPLRVLPTLVAFKGSYAFSHGGQGLVVQSDGQLVDLTLEERERALGYVSRDTAAPGLTADQRHTVIGSCMDSNAMQSLLAVVAALRLQPRPGNLSGTAGSAEAVRGAVPGWAAHSSLGGGKWVADAICRTAGVSSHPVSLFFQMRADALQARQEEAGLLGETPQASQAAAAGGAVNQAGVANGSDSLRDVWLDAPCIELLTQGQLSAATAETLSSAERQRVMRRAKAYRSVGQKVYRKMNSGTMKMVPPPADRAAIVQRLHEECGHFGRRRTTHLVLLDYWWAGVYDDVRQGLASCQVCQRVSNALFNSQRPVLQPLPIMGLFYRWHVDLAGPFPTSRRGNKYVMVAIEAFSKHAEMLPLAAKAPAEVAWHFKHHVLCRFGACAEVVTDQGNEFQGEFAELLVSAFIEHRHTSAYHPQGNGLAERCVQTIKTCLKKLVEGGAEQEDWDELVPWVALGYRITPQDATRISPYHMLFAQQPSIPSAIRDKVVDPLDPDDVEAAAAELARRAQLVARQVIMAGQNLLIAQKRDTLRYARVHSGSYLPKIRRFEVGDYVYTKSAVDRTPPSGLRALANAEVLRVREVRPSGVLVLEGRNGQRIEENILNCAPCHLPITDPVIDWAQYKPSLDMPCEVCHHPHGASTMLVCDGCWRGYHMECLRPPLKKVPPGDWFCDECVRAGRAVSSAEAVPAVTAGGSAGPTLAGAEPPLPGVVLQNGSAPRRSSRLQAKAGPSRAMGAVDGQAGDRTGGTGSANGDGDEGWEGRLVLRQKASNSGLRYPLVGALQKAGNGSGGWTARYSSGEIEQLSREQVAYCLLPQTEPAPRLQAAGTVRAQPWPLSWDLSSVAGARAAAEMLLPGRWTAEELQQLAAAVRQYRAEPDWESRQLRDDWESAGRVELLLGALDFSFMGAKVDPFAGASRRLAAEFSTYGIQLVSNHQGHEVGGGYQLDPLQHGSYARWDRELALDAVVTRPPAGVLDIALPLAVKTARLAVCCQVPETFIAQAAGPRRQWLRKLDSAGRLMIIYGQRQGPKGQRCVWVVVFRARHVADMLRLASAQHWTGLRGRVEH